jgi:hypothetical protein
LFLRATLLRAKVKISFFWTGSVEWRAIAHISAKNAANMRNRCYEPTHKEVVSSLL